MIGQALRDGVMALTQVQAVVRVLRHSRSGSMTWSGRRSC